MGERNAAAPADQRIIFRVGINLGDIIVEGDDIHGDGVNVAARLEAISEASGICVSGTVRDHIGDRLDVAFDDLGEQALKNIARPGEKDVFAQTVALTGAAGWLNRVCINELVERERASKCLRVVDNGDDDPDPAA
jgi:adenylate cyclase